MTDFMNLKIKSGQSFECAYRNRVYIHVFIGVSSRMCMSICIYTVFLKKSCSLTSSFFYVCVGIAVPWASGRLNYFL
jgi:hypothetical protein